jgi:Tol biopolymer transport system component
MNARTSMILAILIIFVAQGVVLLADDSPQYSPWSVPTNLGPVINTPGNDSGPFISRDGLSLYFNSNALGGYGGLDIFVSHRASVHDPWGIPQNLGPNINSSSNDNAVALSNDGHQLYFQSNRPGGFGGTDLYVAGRHNKRDDFGWEPAQNLGSPVNTSANESAPVYFEDDETGTITLYFVSDQPGGMGGTDIYASTLQRDETWGTPLPVPELNSSFNDAQPAIRKDGLEMFVTSNRPGSFSSTADIWVSTRARTFEPWSTPVNLGPLINSPDPYYQGRPSISFDGTTLYFYSFRPGGLGAQDLYLSTRTKLKH